jgi:hypothetical protein
MVLLLTVGQRHEQTMFEPLMERGGVKAALRLLHKPLATARNHTAPCAGNRLSELCPPG